MARNNKTSWGGTNNGPWPSAPGKGQPGHQPLITKESRAAGEWAPGATLNGRALTGQLPTYAPRPYGGANQAGRSQPQATPPSQGAAAQPTAVSGINYQSGVNVGGGIGKGGILAGLLDTGSQADPSVAALTRATAWNDASQIGRGIDASNQEMQMQQQAKRSEATTQGASNIAEIAGDYAGRTNAQIGLAAEIIKNNIGFAAGAAKFGGFR